MIGETARTKISTLVPVLVALVLASFASVLFLDFADAVFSILLAAAALFVAAVDIDRFEIPDIASLAIFALGLALTQVSGIDIAALAQCVLRSVLVAALLSIFRAAYRWVRGLEGADNSSRTTTATGARFFFDFQPVILAAAGVFRNSLESHGGRQFSRSRAASSFDRDPLADTVQPTTPVGTTRSPITAYRTALRARSSLV
jgi:prepilin signal peptidase PulO-like enzyme (type II secretory pathway)